VSGWVLVKYYDWTPYQYSRNNIFVFSQISIIFEYLYLRIIMNTKNKKILQKIFENPTRSDIEWKSVETLLISLGADISEGRGSRIRIYLNGIKAVFHRPHPQKETDKGTIDSLTRFLNQGGINNDDIQKL
jgi:hypothetical protein